MNRFNNRGYTVIEILTAITLGLIVLTSIYSLYSTSQKVSERTSQEAELTQNARIALDRISREIRQTQEILTDLPEDLDDPINPPANQIKFQDGHITAKIQYIRYYLDGTNLHRSVNHYYFSSNPDEWVLWNATDSEGNPPTESVPDEDRTIGEFITNLQFYGIKLIDIDIEVGKDSTAYKFETKAMGRNIK